MKKVFSALLLFAVCFGIVTTVSATTGNGTIKYKGNPFELIEDTGTTVRASVKASSMTNGPVHVNAIMQKKFLFWWTNQANAIITVYNVGGTYRAQYEANAPGTVKAVFENLSSGSSLTGTFKVW